MNEGFGALLDKGHREKVQSPGSALSVRGPSRRKDSTGTPSARERTRSTSNSAVQSFASSGSIEHLLHAPVGFVLGRNDVGVPPVARFGVETDDVRG